VGPSDLDLCRAAAGGDDTAFDLLVGRHAPRLFRVALSLCGSRPDAEDLCQETFLAAYEGIGSFAGRSLFRTWLTTILIRKSSRSWRKRKRDTSYMSLADDQVDQNEVSADDRRLDLVEAIKSLPDDFREVLVLRELEGFSYEEIAEALQLPCGTVQSRLHRARTILKGRLAAYRPADGSGT
jgi:RNA polymerase sigma-70 factor, ECF subfamily